MLRKVFLAVAGVAAFGVAAVVSSSAEAGGPYHHGSFYGGIGSSYRAPVYGGISRNFNYGRRYTPTPYYLSRPPVSYGHHHHYHHGSRYYGRGYSSPGFYYRSPGFSLRLGF